MTSIIPSTYPYPYQGSNSYNSQQVTNPISYPSQDSPPNMVYKSQYIKETGTMKPGRPRASDFFGNYNCINYENGENTTKLKNELKKELEDKINIELEKRLKRLNELNKSSNYSRGRSRDRYSRRNSRSRSRDRYSRNSSRRNSRERSDTKKRRNISIGQYKITPCKYGHNCKHRYAYIHRKGDDCTYLHEGDRDDKNNLVPVSREMAMRLYLKYKNN